MIRGDAGILDPHGDILEARQLEKRLYGAWYGLFQSLDHSLGSV